MKLILLIAGVVICLAVIITVFSLPVYSMLGAFWVSVYFLVAVSVGVYALQKLIYELIHHKGW